MVLVWDWITQVDLLGYLLWFSVASGSILLVPQGSPGGLRSVRRKQKNIRRISLGEDFDCASDFLVPRLRGEEGQTIPYACGYGRLSARPQCHPHRKQSFLQTLLFPFFRVGNWLATFGQVFWITNNFKLSKKPTHPPGSEFEISSCEDSNSVF